MVAVLGLWGTVIYKYVDRFFANEHSASSIKHSYTLKIDRAIVKDTFVLDKINRDPFLSRFSEVVKKPVTTARSAPLKIGISKNPPKINNKLFPVVVYYGYIKTVDRPKETIILRFNGKFVRLHLNQDTEGLKVTTLHKDSIKVVYNKEAKWIRKTKR